MNNEYTLIREITALSTSADWLTVKKEWKHYHAFQREGSTCLCGKQNIINVCVIKNDINQNTAEVGNCCVVKFLDINHGTAIFNSLTKLKKDIKKSISVDCIELMKVKNLITDWEYSFYNNIKTKRKKMSEKQWQFKLIINQKFLNHFSYQGSHQHQAAMF